MTTDGGKQTSFEIAVGVSNLHWARDIEPYLDDDRSDQWPNAIEVLRKRLVLRFIEPAQKLIDDEEGKGRSERRNGFVIIGVHCLLIETLQGFIEGYPTTPFRMGNELFRRFLTTRKAFRGHFTKPLAGQFCDDFRNGIFHQAEIKRYSRVNATGRLLKVEPEGLVIGRNAFHQAMKTELARYLEELSDSTKKQLRDNFRKKMRHIARMPKSTPAKK